MGELKLLKNKNVIQKEEEKEQIEALTPKEGKSWTAMKSESSIVCPIFNHFIVAKVSELKLVQFNKPSPPPPPPFADTQSARRVVRYAFAAMLRHYGVVSEAMALSTFLKNSNNEHPQCPQLTLLSKLWSLCASIRYNMFDELQQIINEEKSKQFTIGHTTNNEQRFQSIINKKKMETRKCAHFWNDDQLKMYLTKLNIPTSNKSRYELI